MIPPPLVLPFLFLALLCVTSFSSMEISLGRGVLALFQRRGRYFSQKCHQRLFRLSSQDGVEKRLWEKLGSGSIVEVVGLYFSNHNHHLYHQHHHRLYHHHGFVGESWVSIVGVRQRPFSAVQNAIHCLQVPTA